MIGNVALMAVSFSVGVVAGAYASKHEDQLIAKVIEIGQELITEITIRTITGGAASYNVQTTLA